MSQCESEFGTASLGVMGHVSVLSDLSVLLILSVSCEVSLHL